MMGLKDYWDIQEPVRLEPDPSTISISEALKLGVIVSVVSTVVFLLILFMGLILW